MSLMALRIRICGACVPFRRLGDDESHQKQNFGRIIGSRNSNKIAPSPLWKLPDPSPPCWVRGHIFATKTLISASRYWFESYQEEHNLVQKLYHPDIHWIIFLCSILSRTHFYTPDTLWWSIHFTASIGSGTVNIALEHVCVNTSVTDLLRDKIICETTSTVFH